MVSGGVLNRSVAVGEEGRARRDAPLQGRDSRCHGNDGYGRVACHSSDELLRGEGAHGLGFFQEVGEELAGLGEAQVEGGDGKGPAI